MEHDDGLAHSSEVAFGTFWGLLGSGITKIISFAYAIFIARAISQEDVGLFYLALGLMGLFGAIRSVGLASALIRYVPFFESRNENGKVRDLLRLTIAVNLATGIFFTLLTWLLADYAGEIYQNPGLPEALRMLSALMLLELLFNIGSGFLQGKADIKGMQLLGNLQNGLKLAVTIILFWLYGASLATLIAAFLLSYAFAAMIAAKLVFDKLGKPEPSSKGLTHSELFREVMPFGLMLSVIQVLWVLVAYSDRVLLGYFFPHQDANAMVAIYSFASILAVNMMIFPSTVGNIFLPTISRLFGKSDMKNVRKTMGTAQRWMLFITVPFSVVMIAFSSEMLTIFYGSGYSAGGAAMAIFCIGLVFSVFSQVISLALVGMRMVGIEFRVALAVFAFNFVLCVLLIPGFGMEGAAAASAASFAISAILFSYYGWKQIGFATSPAIYRLLACGALTCLLIFALKPLVASVADAIPQLGDSALKPYLAKSAYLLLLGVVSALAFAVYGLLALLLKCFAREDITIMKQVAKSARVPKAMERIAENLVSRGMSGD